MYDINLLSSSQIAIWYIELHPSSFYLVFDFIIIGYPFQQLYLFLYLLKLLFKSPQKHRIKSILILPTNLSLRNNRISDKQLLIKILPVHVYRCDLAIVICGVIVDSLVAVAA